jgi:hypothetical protein
MLPHMSHLLLTLSMGKSEKYEVPEGKSSNDVVRDLLMEEGDFEHAWVPVATNQYVRLSTRCRLQGNLVVAVTAQA